MSSQRPEIGAGGEGVDMSDETVFVTGSTDGIGREAAVSFARMGADVVVHGRDRAKGEEVVNTISRTDGSGELLIADLSTQDAVHDLADEVEDVVGGLDVLANNAGGWFSDGRLTEDGVEFTFAVNHLAPFVLTAELLPLLKESDRGRVVTTSSNAHRRGGDLSKDDVTTVDGYSGLRSYCRSKLANVLFTRELSRRLSESGSSVTANCFHPGAIPGSGFARGTPLPFRIASTAVSALPTAIESLIVTTVPEGAETLVYLAASPEVDDVSGEYFKNCRPKEPSRDAKDDGKARDLWETSEDLTGVEYGL